MQAVVELKENLVLEYEYDKSCKKVSNTYLYYLVNQMRISNFVA